jgi:L-ornithine N5-monooxygenase
MEKETKETIVDILGVGFGPANLALAVALAEAPGQARPNALFIEQKNQFTWHPGMLLEGSRAQVPFFKDLATMRNPTSRFSYLNWLHERGLLFQFVASRDFTPMRSELDAYYRWAAGHFTDQVRYGQSVVALRPGTAGPGGRIQLIRAELADVATGELTTVLTRAAVLAPGGTPDIPDCAAGIRGDRVFHTSGFAEALAGYPDRSRPYRFVVVGSGQSAGDTTRYLLDEYPQASVEWVFRGFAPRPLDESPFVNELFDPDARALLLALTQEQRDALHTEHHYANYSAVDHSLLVELYRRRFSDAVLGRERLRLTPFQELVGLDANWARATCTLRDRITGAVTTRPADGVVLATGYRRTPALLDGLAPYLERTAAGTPDVAPDYRVRTVPGFAPAIFLQGLSEATHGPSETLLSLLAVRAGEIAERLTALRPTTVPSPADLAAYLAARRPAARRAA